LVLADGLRREFVNVVGANVSNLRVLPGYFDSLFIEIVRAFDFARKTTLFQSESSRRSMQRSRVLKIVPVAASRQSFDPDIDPDIGSQLRQRLNIGFKENADEISFGFVSADGDAHQPRIFRQGTRPADLKRFILLGKRDPSVSMRECVRLIADRLLALSAAARVMVGVFFRVSIMAPSRFSYGEWQLYVQNLTTEISAMALSPAVASPNCTHPDEYALDHKSRIEVTSGKEGQFC
jgi:hypothetical protein